MKVQHSIKVSYKKTNDAAVAKEWLKGLPDVFSADFETAVRYSKETIEEAKKLSEDTTLSKKERISYIAIAKASALGHPYHCTITHCSIGISENEALVFIIDSQKIANVVLDFLVETEKVQIWHNYAYDGRFLMYYGNKNAKNIEDTQILAKTLINHVEPVKAQVGLKTLAGSWYGDWGISSDNFTLEQQYDEKVIRYAAIDAAATFKLWTYLNDFIDKGE